jgi:transcriptional regulator with XRE-family HTH domain
MRSKTRIATSLRMAIRKSRKSVNQLAKESGVSHPVILRFVSGERDIRLATADKLAAALGVQVVRK